MRTTAELHGVGNYTETKANHGKCYKRFSALEIKPDCLVTANAECVHGHAAPAAEPAAGWFPQARSQAGKGGSGHRAARDPRAEPRPEGTRRVEAGVSTALNTAPPVMMSDSWAHFRHKTKVTFVASQMCGKNRSGKAA